MTSPSNGKKAQSLPAENFRWALVTACNDEKVLRSTLLASPDIHKNCQLIVERSAHSAAQAYNRGLDCATTKIVIFAHQDVYLPEHWVHRLRSIVETLEEQDPNWGVLGVFGMTDANPPRPFGYCYSTGLRRMLGEPFSLPIAARTLDELVLILRKPSGLRFDECLPGFHLYGADICVQAQMRGLGCYIIPAFCIHNANGIVRMPRTFWRAYLYLRHKWRHELPIPTCCTTLKSRCGPMLYRLLIETRDRLHPRAAGKRVTDVTALYERLLAEHPEIALELPASSTKVPTC